MLSFLPSLICVAHAFLVMGQLNPVFFQKPGSQAPRNLLSSANQFQSGLGGLPHRCPNEQPRADVDLPSPIPEGLNKALKSVRSLLNSTVDPTFPALSGKPSAAALQLDYRGKKLASSFVGDKDPKTKSGPPDDTTIFRIGSDSKIFAVLMLYQLYDRGVVSSLDDPLSKYAPDFKMTNVHSRSKRQFTLRQLASQLSGMQRELPCMLTDCALTTREIIERLNTEPGAQLSEYTQPSYSNAAYALLGNVLADYVNMSYADYVQRNILEPLGMHDTGFVFTEAVEQRMAKPYSNETLIGNADIGYNAPAGQMYSTVKDMMLLGRYFLGLNGDLFDDGLRKELLMPGFLWRDGAFMQGSPWEIQLLNGNWALLGKGGNIFGFSAVFGMIPPLNLTFSALWSGMVDETSFVSQVYEQILTEFLPVLSSQRPAPTLPNDPEKYVGTYQASVPMFGPKPMVIQIQKTETLVVTVNGAQQGWLNFRNNHTAIVESFGEDGQSSCFGVMAGADLGLWFSFDVGVDGKVVAVEMPGSLYGVKFVKQDHKKTPIQEVLVV